MAGVCVRKSWAIEMRRSIFISALRKEKQKQRETNEMGQPRVTPEKQKLEWTVAY